MADDELVHRVEGGVSWITLNRPESYNAITPDQRERIIALLSEASERLEVRAVVLTATGKGFCTGADLRASRYEAPPRPEGAPERSVGDVTRLIRSGAQRLVAALLDCEKPVVAGLNGTAAGLGVHLALACDLVIMSDQAKLVEVFARRGLVPDGGGAYLLTRLVGPQKAKEIMFFADDLGPDDALRLGLVNRVVPHDDLDAALGDWAGRLAQAPTKALSLAKRLVNRSLDTDRESAFLEEAMAVEICSASADQAEGVASFRERRAPEFTGW